MSRFTGTYADDWKATANVVKAAAGWRCVRCNASHDPKIGRCLTVHHFDGDKANNARWNCMALCQRCHLSVQSRVDPHVPLIFDPSRWAMPYIAGFYAAGHGTPGPTYELERWVAEYESAGWVWPEWAPAAPPVEARA